MCPLITRTLAAEQDFAHWFSACRPDGILFQYQPVRAGWDGLPGSVPRGLDFVHLDWSPNLVPLADPAHDSELRARPHQFAGRPTAGLRIWRPEAREERGGREVLGRGQVGARR